ncbi:MAG: hypothetical protein K6G91_03505 [Kiritimatiellae bacterium]|nr:hypothetical protein [Kiritimatiellia bacterium]
MGIRVCHKLLPFIMAATTSFMSVASERTEGVAESNLKSFLQSIACEGTNYLFALKPGFVYSINNSEVKVCNDEKNVALNSNSELFILERHSSLVFAPMPTKGTRQGFRVLHIKDFRSFGGNVTTNYAYLITADEKSDSSDEMRGSSDTNAVARTKASVSAKAGTPEKKFLKGLKLLPCD